jgi:predicted Holliday junction resolvase-like endonuclease
MIIDIILIITIIICLLGVIFILVRKLPLLTTIPQNQQAEIKKNLLKEQLKRRLAEARRILDSWLLRLKKQNKKS